MTDLYYSAVPSGDAPGAMALPGCVTQDPRLSLDGTLALIAYDEDADGRLSQADAITLMATDEWSDLTEIPQ